MLSVAMRSDWRYLETDETEPERRDEERNLDRPNTPGNRERTANYYVRGESTGEPAGRWWGRGAEGLGLSGVASSEVMDVLYGRLEDPGTREALGTRPRRYASFDERYEAAVAAEIAPTPERLDELRIEVRKAHREARHYADLCFSPAKSWSVRHAALERAGRHEEAAELWEAWMTGVKAGLEYLMDEVGYSRKGYHGREVAGRSSGEWIDAHDFVISLWRHHTSRDGDPQLHVHAAVLNRVLCSDGVWRSLDSKALHAARPAAGAICERVAEEELSRRQGVRFMSRGDGVAREIAGISPELRDLFSTRRRAITKGVEALAAAYRAKHLAEPRPYDLRLMAEFITVSTRKPKAHKSRDELLAEWEARTYERFGKGLDNALESARVDPNGPAPALSPLDRQKVIALAIADVEGAKTVWNRHDLLAAINTYLPDSLGTSEPAEVRRVLNGLVDEALACTEVTNLTAPELIEVPEHLRRTDGRSRFEPHDPSRYASTAQMSREERLIYRAQSTGAPKLSLDEANRLITERGLVGDQAEAVRGILTSGRWLESLVGPAGAGKSYTIGQLVEIWERSTGAKTFGLATSQLAVQVMAAEGVKKGANIAKFLHAHELIAAGKGSARQRGTFGLSAGQLVIVDEASMVSSQHLEEIRRIAEVAGAKVLLTGDPYQLAAPGAGGGMGLVVREVGAHELGEVRRFEAEWEREASLRLRAGDESVLLDYDRRGRLLEGSAEEMTAAVAEAFVADHLGGRQSLVVTGTNESAAEVSSQIRASLVALGRVEAGGVTLHDSNAAGRGDLIQVRKNEKGFEDDWRPVTNREVYRVVGMAPGAGLLVERQLGRDDNDEQRWGPRRTLPGWYVAERVELAYGSTAHSAQGRTVDTCHLLADDRLNRRSFYVGMTRGRHANIAYAVVGEDADRLAVLAPLVERQDRDLTALEVWRDEYEAAEHLGRRGPIYTALLAEAAARRYDAELERLLGREAAGALRQDQASSSALYRLLRTSEAQGYDGPSLLAEVVQSRELASADSAAQVLHYRLSRLLDRSAETQALGAVLGAELAAELRTDPAAPGLWQRLARAEAEGSDRRTLLARAVAQRDFDDARSVAQVLHHRIGELTKDGPVTEPTADERDVEAPAPFEPKRFVDAVPAAEEPTTKYLRDVAEAMDRRAAGLGEQAAAEPPAWASRLGPVPDEPLARQEWTERASAIAAYREQFGYEHETDAIGASPGRGDPDRRAAWEQAYRALGSPESQRETARLSDGQLERIVVDYEREEEWAPPNVDEALRKTHLALRDTEARAAREAAKAQLEDRTDVERDAHAVRASRAEVAAEGLRRRTAAYEEVAGTRSAWMQERAEERCRYESALAEKARREPRQLDDDAEPERAEQPVRGDADRDQQAPEPAELEPEQAAREVMDVDTEVAAQLRQARSAQELLDMRMERQRGAQRREDAERDETERHLEAAREAEAGSQIERGER